MIGGTFLLRHDVIATKLHPPAGGATPLPRPRLLDLLSAFPRYRLVLVTAPAGSGKSTFLVQWQEHLKRPGVDVAWVSLDSGDNHVRRLFLHIAAALSRASPDLARHNLMTLMASPDHRWEHAMTGLIDAMISHGRPIVIILDDVHALTDREPLRFLESLLSYLPDTATLALSARGLPPIPVAKLQVNGVMVRIGWDELRFTDSEALSYLRRHRAIAIDDGDLQRLIACTEGWIAGLQLASLILHDHPDPVGFAADVSGARAEFTDYLIENVLAGLPASVRRFLLVTAVPDRLCGALADALTGRTDGQTVLEILERKDLFIVRLDAERRWYRYHHLFAAFLRTRLALEQPALTRALHAAASRWFERNGSAVEALHHAVAGGHHETAARLLHRLGRAWFRTGDFKTLHLWCDRLPDAELRRHPALCALHGWACAYLGVFDAARTRIAWAEAGIADHNPANGPCGDRRGAALAAEVQILRAALGVIESDEPDTAGLVPDVVDLVDPDDSAMRGFGHVVTGYACRSVGRLSRARHHFESGAASALAADSALVYSLARFNTGTVDYLAGRLRTADAVLAEAQAVTVQRRWQHTLGASFLAVQRAAVLHEQDRLVEARTALEAAEPILRQSQGFGFLGVALVEQARLGLAENDWDGADAALSAAREIARRHGVIRVLIRADVVESLAMADRGDIDRAVACLNRLAGYLNQWCTARSGVFTEQFESLELAQTRLLLERGADLTALRRARAGIASARAAERHRNLALLLSQQAVAWHRLGRSQRAAAKLGQAIALVDGMIRSFRVAGPGLVPVLATLARMRPDWAALIGRIAAAVERGRAAKTAARPDPASAGCLDLHPRERQILELISLGLRNREIGDRLCLSEETVKWYLKNLYGRLDVRSRTQAVAIARANGLVR